MKTEILALLRESSEHISGQELCSRFGVSRTAIWKVMNQLKAEGYQIEAISNKGYRLCNQPDVLTVGEIAGRLTTRVMGRELYCLTETASTNAEARRLGEEGCSHGTLITAEAQLDGRGRRGRSWVTSQGDSIAMSLLLRPDFPPIQASMLTLIMALSVCEAMEEICGIQPAIKWPNDIVYKEHKICGILTEMNTERDYIHWVIIGVGINVNQTGLPEDIRETAASLRILTGQETLRSELIARILKSFEKNYDIFVKTGNMEAGSPEASLREEASLLEKSSLLEDYNKRLINRDREVRVLDPQEPFTGCARGVNAKGELMVERESGEVVAVYAGEVSVRGLYGYV